MQHLIATRLFGFYITKDLIVPKEKDVKRRQDRSKCNVQWSIRGPIYCIDGVLCLFFMCMSILSLCWNRRLWNTSSALHSYHRPFFIGLWLYHSLFFLCVTSRSSIVFLIAACAHEYLWNDEIMLFFIWDDPKIEIGSGWINW